MKKQISMKQVFLLIFLLAIEISFSQSKKEQIEILTNRVDSLKHVVITQSKTINDKNSQISVLNTKITSLESNLSVLNDNVSKLSSELQTFKTESKTKQQELIAKNTEISNLQLQIKSKTDSLNLLLAELEKLKPAPKPVVTNNNTGKVTQTGSFKSVKIGAQTWMSENLNVSTFRNGDLIPEAKTNEEWEKAGKNKQPAWCYYNNDPKNGAKYGKLYNWYAVIDPRGLAPEGWHVLSDEEWQTLEDYLGDDAGKKMKSASGWDNWQEDITCSNCKNWNSEYRSKTACHVCQDTRVNGEKTHSGNGTNSTGFSGLPGGIRNYGGTFFDVGYYGYWWSSTETGPNYAWYRYLYYSNGNVLRDSDFYKAFGFSVRCLKD
jgi:uncharacterized protein (TIGR02145 family)